MHKFVSFLFALLLLMFFVLPNALARPRPLIVRSGPLDCPDGYLTRVIDHNPPTLTIVYCPTGTDADKHSLSRRKGFLPKGAIQITVDAKGLHAYAAQEASLLFYTARDGKFVPLAPQTYFNLNLDRKTQTVDRLKLTTPLVGPDGQRAKPGEPTSAAVQFSLKPTVALPQHLLVVAALRYTSPGGGIITKGPLFSTLLLEPPRPVMLIRRHDSPKRVR